MARIEFRGQPFGSRGVGAALQEALAVPGRKQVWMATAWAKRSGLGRIAGGLRDVRATGGHAEAVLGIDENGASKEGLELALELFQDAFIFHDPGNRTYHPKVYAVEHESGAALLIVGSANATRGGLFTNYEAALAVELELGTAQDALLLAEARSYV